MVITMILIITGITFVSMITIPTVIIIQILMKTATLIIVRKLIAMKITMDSFVYHLWMDLY